MAGKTASVIQRNSFWIVLVCHVLLFLSMSWVWIVSPKRLTTDNEERPSLSIPAYVYHDDLAPATQAMPTPKNPPPANRLPTKTTLPTSKIGIKKPAMTHAQPVLNINHPIDISHSPDTEPVQLVGDKKIDKPLLTLLGKALTKHLVYPKSALDLNVKGTSIIGFLLYPDGRVSDVQLLRTSRAEVLDNAALAAANAISPVNHVGPYLAKPKFMVIGIIFE